MVGKQVDHDGVVTLYQSNGKGEPAYTATDLNANDVIDFDLQDRITCTVSDVTTAPRATERGKRKGVNQSLDRFP